MISNAYNRNKYKNYHCEMDGIKFDSKKEMFRYLQLKNMEKRKEITALQLQKEFILQPAFRDVTGKKQRAIKYKCDFYYRKDGEYIIEDVKSEITRKDKVYVMKKKMMAYKGLIVTEV